jgi:hypothetical protein
MLSSPAFRHAPAIHQRIPTMLSPHATRRSKPAKGASIKGNRYHAKKRAG